MAGGGLSSRDSGILDYRDVHEAQSDVVPESASDGDRGKPSQLASGRRGPDGRLRQNNSRLTDGRHQHESSMPVFSRRADAPRALERHASRELNRSLDVLGRAMRRNYHGGGMERDGGWHRALSRVLHDNGHGSNYDGVGRSARSHSAG